MDENIKSFTPMGEIIDKIFTQYFGLDPKLIKTESWLPEVKERKLTSGIASLDELIGEFSAGKLYTILGRTAMGKTSLLKTIAFNMAWNTDKPIYIFALEETKEDMVTRFVAHLVHRSPYLNYLCRYKEQCSEYLYRFWFDLRQLSIYINDDNFMMDEIMEITENEIHDGIVFIDSLQLIDKGVRGNRPLWKTKEKKIARKLKSIAKEKGIPIVVTSNASREIEKRKDRHPTLEDIVFHYEYQVYTDTVIAIYRDRYYHYHCDNPKDEEAELIVLKNIDGPTGTAIIHYDRSSREFYDEKASRKLEYHKLPEGKDYDEDCYRIW